MRRKSTISDCVVMQLNNLNNDNGIILIDEILINIPFEVKRIYYLYDVTKDGVRGQHAHKDLFQLITAPIGSFDIEINDGSSKKIISLNNSNQGLLVVPGIWRKLYNFSSGSVCLVLASLKYDESDYIRHFDDYIKFKKNEK
jgi:hypothetical protein